MSHPQAKRWKSAKTKPPAYHWPRDAVPGKPAHHQHGRHGGATPQNRWKDAETAPPPHGRRPWRTAIRTWPSSAGSQRRTALAASHVVLPWTGLATAFAASCKSIPSTVPRKGLPLARGRLPQPPWPPLPEAWHPPESNKGVSEGLSALGGKRTRVRHESPSKTPKNGF